MLFPKNTRSLPNIKFCQGQVPEQPELDWGILVSLRNTSIPSRSLALQNLFWELSMRMI